MKHLLAIACACVVAACTTPQRDITPGEVASLQEGQATAADVVGKLGRAPTSLAAGGLKRLIYYVGGATSLPGDEEPGAPEGLHGGIVIFVFDGSDRLIDKTVPDWFVAQGTQPVPAHVATSTPARVAGATSAASGASGSAPTAVVAAAPVATSASAPVVTAAAPAVAKAASQPWWAFHIKFGGEDPGAGSH